MRPARHIMTTYRRFLVEGKRSRNRDMVSQGRAPSRRIMRALLHYRAYVDAYLRAKLAVLAGEPLVDA